MIYPLCVFHKLSYENGKMETSCEYPFIDITECFYGKNEECIYKMTFQDLYEDWVRLKFLTEPMLYEGEK